MSGINKLLAEQAAKARKSVEAAKRNSLMEKTNKRCESCRWRVSAGEGYSYCPAAKSTCFMDSSGGLETTSINGENGGL